MIIPKQFTGQLTCIVIIRQSKGKTIRVTCLIFFTSKNANITCIYGIFCFHYTTKFDFYCDMEMRMMFIFNYIFIGSTATVSFIPCALMDPL